MLYRLSFFVAISTGYQDNCLKIKKTVSHLGNSFLSFTYNLKSPLFFIHHAGEK